tara:strand:- start:14 stop:604 length:591 start_codon:yes stop_codon:yes gene_type:complete
MSDHWSHYIAFENPDAYSDGEAPITDERHDAVIMHALDTLWENSPENGKGSFKEFLRDNIEEGQKILLKSDLRGMNTAGHGSVNINLIGSLCDLSVDLNGEHFLPPAARVITHEIHHAIFNQDLTEADVIASTNDILKATFGPDVIMRDPQSHKPGQDLNWEHGASMLDKVAASALENTTGTSASDVLNLGICKPG